MGICLSSLVIYQRTLGQIIWTFGLSSISLSLFFYFSFYLVIFLLSSLRYLRQFWGHSRAYIYLRVVAWAQINLMFYFASLCTFHPTFVRQRQSLYIFSLSFPLRLCTDSRHPTKFRSVPPPQTPHVNNNCNTKLPRKLYWYCRILLALHLPYL